MRQKKFIIVELTPEEHNIIKLSAVNRYMSMKKWVLEAIVEKINTEKQYK